MNESIHVLTEFSWQFQISPSQQTRSMKIINTRIAQPAISIQHLNKYNKKLCIATQKHQIIIEKSNILYLKADGNYCEIHMLDGTLHCCSKALKEILSRISENNFLKVHKSYVVNLEYLNYIDSAFTRMGLEGKNEIPIARSRKEIIKRAISSNFD